MQSTAVQCTAHSGRHSMGTDTPIAERAAVVIVGDRNAGKSSLMNALFERNVAIVSDTKGTTTDPVLRKMELIGLGAISVTDTAGLDDVGELGIARIAKTQERLDAADLVLFATDGSLAISESEKQCLKAIKDKNKNAIIVMTHSDMAANESKMRFLHDSGYSDVVSVCVASGAKPCGIELLIKCMEDKARYMARELTPLEGLVQKGDCVVLVMPQDSSAPKGRLILPQVETLRDALDRGCIAVSVDVGGLEAAIDALNGRPDLVVTDSQAFAEVSDVLDRRLEGQRLTSFSILFARKKGDMQYFTESLEALAHFPKGGKVLVMEACNHHRQDDDIGTVKIPALFHKKVDESAQFEIARELPKDIADYALVIHCAACMTTRAAVLARVETLKRLGIPTINYGLFLAWANGLLPRATDVLHGQDADGDRERQGDARNT